MIGCFTKAAFVYFIGILSEVPGAVEVIDEKSLIIIHTTEMGDIEMHYDVDNKNWCTKE